MIRMKLTIELTGGTPKQVETIVAAVRKAADKVKLPAEFAAFDAPDPTTGPGEEPPPSGGQ